MAIGSSKRRMNAAEQAERQWAANRPADYVNQNKEAMDAVTGQVGSGFDWNTAADAYQQYRQRATQSAQAAADNAKANAASLAGGYGSSYADSVAAQNQRQALAGIDNALPSLRSQALAEYQDKQNSLLNALSGMATTEGLNRAAYGANLANFQSWRNYLANKSEQARNEYASDKENLWGWVKNIGSAALTAYDGYKGYTAQQQQAQAQAINYAVSLKQQGADDAAKAVLEAYKVDPAILDNYTGQTPITWKDQLSGLATASGLMGSGDQAGAYSYLDILGMPQDSIDSYDTVANRAFEEYMNKKLLSKSLSASGKSSGSGRSSGSSRSTSGSSKSGSGWTNSQVLTALGKYQSLSDDDPTKAIYADILEEAGMLPQGTGSKSAYTAPSAGALTNLDMGRKWGTLNTTGTSTTRKSSGENRRLLAAQNAVRGQRSRGADDQTIYNSLRLQGYTEDEIYEAMNS